VTTRVNKLLSLNSVNCWEPLRANNATTWPVTASVNVKKLLDWEISSQSTVKVAAGSTIRESIRLGEISKSAEVLSALTTTTNTKLMEASMFSIARKYRKVFNSIISVFSVNMMNNFLGLQIPTKVGFHNKSMLQNVSPFIFERMVGALNHNVGNVSFCDKPGMKRVPNLEGHTFSELQDIGATLVKDMGNFASGKSIPNKLGKLFPINSAVPGLNCDSKKFHMLKDVLFGNMIFTGNLQRRFKDVVVTL